MVTQTKSRSAREQGAMMTELLVAMAILVVALMPLAFSLTGERRVARAYYQRAVAMEIVDGEMEVLMAGGWRNFAPGTHEYPLRGGAATNLPPGQLLLTVEANKLRLEWKPAVRQHGGHVVREVTFK
jgi:hypothetical protein